MRILITGGSGLLGRELRKVDPRLLAPPRTELDVTDPRSIDRGLDEAQPDTIIHAAAVTNNRLVEEDPSEAIRVNIQGTANLALVCRQRGIRLVYLSTDYVYQGDRGHYREDDEIQPFNLYAWTKLAGEASVRCVPDHLILRTSFGAVRFEYPRAFVDKWSSKLTVEEIGPIVLEAAASPLTGVLNLGGPRMTLFEYAQRSRPDVRPVARKESAQATPFDTSLNLDRWKTYVTGKGLARGHGACRVCGSPDLHKYLDLGLMPLANNLASSAAQAREMERVPLQVCFCSQCSLSQLSVVVDPNELFRHYTYRSSVSKSFARHCRQMAQAVGKIVSLGKDDLVVDIAGNDGTLLAEFKDELGVRVVNVDPASNIAAVALSRGIPTINDFWSAKVASQLNAEYGRPKAITATNVFAHVDDVRGFLQAGQQALREDGVFVLEFPYLVDFIEHREFDTVYFEHLSYFSIQPLVNLAASLGMTVFRVDKQEIHGGTARVFIAPRVDRAAESSVEKFLALERTGGYLELPKYKAWANDIRHLIDDLSDNLARLKASGKKIAAFGASAKGNTLLNACRLTTGVIDYIVDDTPEKIGKYSPGTGIPIVPRSRLAQDRPDYLLILAWNFAREIMENTSDYGRHGGKYLLPIPRFSVVEPAP